MDSTAAAEADAAKNFRFTRMKAADAAYNFTIKGKMPNGSRTEWKSNFDRSLEYLMFPSLQLLPQEIQEVDIIAPVKKTGYDKKTLGLNASSIGSTSPKAAHGHSHGGKGSPTNRRSPSPGRRGWKKSPVSPPVEHNPFDDDRSPSSQVVEEESEVIDYTRPNLYWDVSIAKPDMKRPDDAKALKEKEFQRQLNEIGEKFNRQRLVDWYEDGVKAAEVAVQEKKREQLKLSAKKAVEAPSPVSVDSDARRRGRGISMKKDIDKAQGKTDYTAGRRSSNMVGIGMNAVANLNAPEYVYKSLRIAGKKKSGVTGILGDMIKSSGLGVVGENGGGMIDDEETYNRQKAKLKILFGEHGYAEHAFDMEGLLYYRFHFDEQMEAERIEREKVEDARMALRRPGQPGCDQFGHTLDLKKTQGVHVEEDQGPLMNEYKSHMMKTYKGVAQITSDASNVNLSRLRRAVQQSLNGLSRSAMADQEEIIAASKDDADSVSDSIRKENIKNRSPIKRPQTSPSKGASPDKNGRDSPTSAADAANLKKQKAIHAIRDKEKAAFLMSMGLDQEVTEMAVQELMHPMDKTPKNKNEGINLPVSPEDKPYGLEAGASLGGIATYSPDAHKSSRTGKQGVSGSTRTAQDNLIMAQLEAGIVPQSFIRRSDNLEFLDIDISHFGIGDDQGLCLGTAIKGLKDLRKLNLEDNRLTSKSIPSIVNNAFVRTLVSLNLSSNTVHQEGSRAISFLICDAQCVLTELSLSTSGLTCSDLPPLMQGLRRDGSTVTNLNLSNNQIAVQGSMSLSDLLSFDRCAIRRLDLSWNKVGTDGAVAIANSLCKNNSLHVLLLTANGIADRGGQRLAVSLDENSSLVEMSLAQNNITGGSCFVFSKTIARHPKIGKLDLSFNPVGEAGARSIYRQIMRGLRCFVIMRSCSYFVQEDIFNYTTPSLNSPYELDLSEPYKAAIIAELMIMVKEDPSSCRFGAVKYTPASTGPAGAQATDDIQLYEKNGEILHGRRPYKPPKTGKLHVQFFSAVSRPTIKNAASAKSIEVTILIVKFAREQDRLDYLKLITADMYMTCAQSQSIINAFVKHKIIGSGGLRKIDILACTWTRLLDTENMYDFMCANIQPSERRTLINEVSIDEYKFNWTNPTGHWRLNLENRKQLFVMMKLISINGQEAEFSQKKSGREDTSQEGNWFNFRNAKLITRKGASNMIIDQSYVDNLPRSGIIDFDYVSTTRPGQSLMFDEKFNLLAKNAAVQEEEDHDDGVDVPQESRPGSTQGGSHPPSRSTVMSKNVYDKIEVISDNAFYDLLARLGLSNRKRVANENSLFPLIELQLAVTKYYFSVTQVMAMMDCFDQQNYHTQANVAVTMFSRVKDLHNFDTLMRNTADIKVQREILSRLGCLNVINPLKLALNYLIPMLCMDYRILLTTLLEISPQEGTEQIREDPKTDVSVLTFYGALHRIIAVSRPDVLRFNYLDFGVQFGSMVAWGLRRDAIKKFLVGTYPIDKSMFRIIGMYREMEKHGTLTRGPIELQYANHLKLTKNIKKAAANNRNSITMANALRAKVTDVTAVAKQHFADGEVAVSAADIANREMDGGEDED